MELGLLIEEPNFITDSKTAIKATTSNRVNSKTGLESINTINNYSQHGSECIVGIPGHVGFRGKGLVKCLAKIERE